MSSIDEARSLRYFIDALQDSDAAEILINNGKYAAAMFHVEQLCEKSTKASLAIISILITKEHLFSSYVKDDIIPASGELKDSFTAILPVLRKIQVQYVSSRYGVDIYGRISFEKYEEAYVKELYRSSLDYLELCFKFAEQKYGKPIPRDIDGLNKLFKTNYIGYITKS